MKAAALALLILVAPPATSPVDLAESVDANALLGIQLGASVAEFIGTHASKEDTESLGPDARGFRRFRVVASARAPGVDEIVVYFRENRVFLIAAVQTRAAEDAGSWTQLVTRIGGRFVALENEHASMFGRYLTANDDATAVPAERGKMLAAFALGERVKSLKLRERAGWSAKGGEVGAFWFEDGWAKRRTYVVTLARTAEADAPALEALFVAEKAYFAEHDTYTTDLIALQYRAESRGVWVYGFCNEYPSDDVAGLGGRHDSRRNHSMHPVLVSPADKDRLAPLADPCKKLEELGLADRFHVSSQSFRAFAIGNTDADADLEVWSIDEKKNVERVRSDSE